MNPVSNQKANGLLCQLEAETDDSEPPWQPRWCLSGTALGYFAVTWLGIALDVPGQAAVIAPANAFLLCILLWTPARRWPLYLAVTLAAALVAEAAAHVPWQETFGEYLLSLAGILGAAGFVRRYLVHTPSFERFRELIVFLLAAVIIAPTLSAVLGLGFDVAFHPGAPLAHKFHARFMQSALAYLTFAPLMLLWRPVLRIEGFGLAPRRLIEAGSIIAALFLIGGLAFGRVLPADANAPVAAYACLPFLLWAVGRFGLRGAVSASFVLVLVAGFCAARGRGPFSAGGEELLAVQLYLLVVCLSLLVFAVLLSERDLANRQLRQSELSYREVFNATGDAIFLHDAQTGRVLDVNDAMLKLYGCERGDLDGLSPDVLTADDPAYPPERALAMIKRTNAEGPQTFEWHARKKDGPDFWVEVSLRASKIGGQERVLAAVRDITKRRAVEEALRNSEEHFRTLFEAAGDGIILMRDDRFIDCNSKALELYGVTREEFREHAPFEFSPPAQPDGSESRARALEVLRAAGEGMPQNFEWRHARKDGSEFDVEVNLSPVRMSGETIIQARVTDITGRKEAEAIQKQANAELESKTQALQSALRRLRASEEELSAAYSQLKASEEDLRKSEERFRLLIESGTDIIGIVDSSGIIRYESPSVERVLGYTPGERRGTQALSYAHPDDVESASKIFQTARQESGAVRRMEARFRHKEGTWRILECVGRNLLDDPVLKGVITTSRDVTEQRRGERAIRALVEGTSGTTGADFFLDFARHLADALDVRFVLVSKLLGDGHAKTLAVWREGAFVPNFDYPLAGTPCVEVIRQGRRVHIEKVTEQFPEDRRFAELGMSSYIGMPLFASTGEVLGLISIMDEDLREQAPIAESLLRIFSVRAAMEIERTQALDDLRRLAQVVEQAEELVIITDTQGRIQYVNPIVNEIMGYGPGELMGQDVRVLKSGEHTPAFYRGLWETIKRGESWTGRFTNRNTSGAFVQMDATITPLRDASGTIVGFISTQRDVTHEAELEAQLRQSQKMEAIGTLAGGIAHDFNNILSAILGYAELALDDATPEGRGHGALIEVRKAGMRAADLVRQILTFSRQGEQERRPLRLGPIVKEAMKLMRSSIPATIDIQTEIDERCPLIMGDPTQVHQVILNLCTNAYHAMEFQGGVLTVALAQVRLSAEEARAYINILPGDYACLTVRDTGHGMDEHVKQRIFDPYFTTKDEGKGTGLGLAIVHGIVTSHGGAITVHSELREGAEFKLYFPALESLESFSMGKRLSIHHGRGERLLLVDDEEPVLRSTERLLERIGYRVMAYLNSREALEDFRARPEDFDLALTDHTMPGMTGVELARHLLEIRPGLPVILTTGMPNVIQTSDAQEVGFRAFLAKPVSLPELSAELRRVLNSAKGAAE